MFGKLFGKSGAKATSDAHLDALRRQYSFLLLEVPEADFERALESWAWIGLPHSKPVMVSAFGDLFFKAGEGILMLDTLEGTLRRVAADFSELGRRLEDDDSRDELLSDVWVQAAARRGLVLERGECLDWSVPPALGGAMSADAITKMSFVVKVNLAGQLHGQIKALPPGTKINRVTISD